MNIQTFGLVVFGIIILLLLLRLIISNTDNSSMDEYTELKYKYDYMLENFKPEYDIPVLRTTETAQLPTRGSVEAAGYDLRADLGYGNKVTVEPHSTTIIDTGLVFALPDGYFGGIYARSGLAIKQGIRPSNCVGELLI